jgi:hypothetical protein
MPFTKIGNNTYRSPSGRQYNGAQVRLWYANGGKFPGEQGPGEIAGRNGERANPGSDAAKRSIHNVAQPRLRIGRVRYGI